MAFVEGPFLFASAMDKFDPKPFEEMLKKGEIKKEEICEIYQGSEFVIRKFPLQGAYDKASAEYMFGPSVLRKDGIPHWKLAIRNYWRSDYMPHVDHLEIRRIDVRRFKFYELGNNQADANQKEMAQDESLQDSKFDPLHGIHDEYEKKYGSVGSNPRAEYEGIYVDFLPTGEDSVQAFVNWDGNVRSWQGKYMKDKKGKWYTEWNPKVVEQIDAGFSEPFYAWAKGDDLFFVTKSGKLYYSKKPATGKRKATALWTDGRPIRGPYTDRETGRLIDQGSDKNPIRGLIFDADSNKGFAFTRPKPENRDQPATYFELAAPLTPHPYPGFKLDKPPDNYTVRTLMEYAQFLIAQKEIKIKP